MLLQLSGCDVAVATVIWLWCCCCYSYLAVAVATVIWLLLLLQLSGCCCCYSYLAVAVVTVIWLFLLIQLSGFCCSNTALPLLLLACGRCAAAFIWHCCHDASADATTATAVAAVVAAAVRQLMLHNRCWYCLGHTAVFLIIQLYSFSWSIAYYFPTIDVADADADAASIRQLVLLQTGMQLFL